MSVQRSEGEERRNHTEECALKKNLKKETNPDNLQDKFKNTPSLLGIQSWMPSYSHH